MRTQLINKTQLIKLMLLCIVLLLPGILKAQDDLPCGGDDPYATECSLDGWLSVLLVAGVVYGAYAISRGKKAAEKITDREIGLKNIVSQL